MLQVDDAVAAALAGTQTGSTRATAVYQGAQVQVQVVQSGSVSYDGDGEVQASGDITAFGVGDSLVPKTFTDPLAPFGQELLMWRDVRVRNVTWPIPLGVFGITKAEDSSEEYRGPIVRSWSVDVSFADRFDRIRADDFLAVEAPMPGNSVWDEVRRLSPIPVQEALGDADVPAATVYDSRLGAIKTLVSLLGGKPTLTRQGVLTARPNDAWLTASTDDAVFDFQGIITWSDEMSNDWYNQVQVKSSSDSSIVAYATISEDSNPLSVSRAGGRTYRHSSPVYTSFDEAQAGANSILARLSTQRSRLVTVTIPPIGLLLELGDVGWIRDPNQRKAAFGEVASLDFPLDPTLPVKVGFIVAEVVAWEPPATPDPLSIFDLGVYNPVGFFTLTPGDELVPTGVGFFDPGSAFDLVYNPNGYFEEP